MLLGVRDQWRSLRSLLLFAVAVCFSLAIVLFVRQISHAKANPNSMGLDRQSIYLRWFVASHQSRPALDLDPPSKGDLFRNSPMQVVMDKITARKAAGHVKPLKGFQPFQDEPEQHPTTVYADTADKQLPVEMLTKGEVVDAKATSGRQSSMKEALPLASGEPVANQFELDETFQGAEDNNYTAQASSGVENESSPDWFIGVDHLIVPYWYTLQSEENRLFTTSQVYANNTIQEMKACVSTQENGGCIQPHTQMVQMEDKPRDKIFLATTNQDETASSRLHAQLVDGLRRHLAFNATEDVVEADFVIAVTTDDTLFTRETFDPKTLIVIDDSDAMVNGQEVAAFSEPPLAYFKSRFVHKSEGVFRCYPLLESNHATIYPVSDALIAPDSPRPIVPLHARSIDILFGHTFDESAHHNSQLTVREWLHKYSEASAGLVSVLYTSNSAQVEQLMCQSKIVVLTNPTNSENFQHILKAMACGALVFTDWIYTPHPYSLIHLQHLVYYSLSDETQFIASILEMLGALDEAQRIADQGFMHALSKHTTVSLVDYIVRSAISNQQDNSFPPPQYTWTGEELTQMLEEQLCPNSLRQSLNSSLFITTP